MSTWIIMGKDECGMEFRAHSEEFESDEVAYNHLDEAQERYPEARSFWIEELKNMDYYFTKYQNMYEDDTNDLH